MATPAHTQEFEDAITVRPLEKDIYAANLTHEWSVGSVPNGGYVCAVLYRLATTHFKHAHPQRHNSDPMPISMQLSFLRRSSTGPALLTVKDLKLGQRTSTIQVSLSQEEASRKSPNCSASPVVKVTGFITVSDVSADVGIDLASAWTMSPPPPDTQPPQLVNNQLESGSVWKRIPIQNADFRRASSHSEIYGLSENSLRHRVGISDQWARLRPHGPKGGLGRWTNDAVAYLIDIFPMTLGNMEVAVAEKSSPSSERHSPPPALWFPTVMLNVDFKKKLPSSGVEWLFSRITSKSIRNGRTDIEVILLDEQGEVVALATQQGLLLSSERNTKSTL